MLWVLISSTSKNENVDTHEKRLMEVLLMSVHNMFLWRNKKNIYQDTPHLEVDYIVIIIWQFSYHTPYQPQDTHISPRGEGHRADMRRRLIWGMIRTLPYHNLFIIYFSF